MLFNEIKKLIESSQDYLNFKKENQEAFLSSVFFITNNQFEFETRQFDYFIEKEKKLMSFILDNEDHISNKLSELYNQKVVITKETAIDKEIKIDFNELKEVLEEKLKENKQDMNQINKIILVLHKRNKEICWNLTCILSNLKVYSLLVDAINKNVLSEKISDIHDYIKIDNSKKLK